MKPLADHIREHREKCERATPGPWQAHSYEDPYDDSIEWIVDFDRNNDSSMPSEANAAHIAANSPEIVRALLDVVGAAYSQFYKDLHGDDCPCSLCRALAALHAAYEAGERSKT